MPSFPAPAMDSGLELNPNEVALWLQNNPGFFEEYADVIAEIFVPHPHGGRAIPIAERQILTLREKQKKLQLQLNDLLQFGAENDLISDKVHSFTLGLIQGETIEDILGVIYDALYNQFGIPHVAVRLWPLRAATRTAARVPENIHEFSPVSEEVRKITQSLAAATPYCGPQVIDEVRSWMGDVGAELQSFAEVAFKHQGETLGLMVMGSPDPRRFFPEMETLYLSRMGEMISQALVHAFLRP